MQRLVDIGLEWKRRALVAELKLEAPVRTGVERAREIVRDRIKAARDSRSESDRVAILEEVIVYLTAEIDRLTTESLS